MRKKIYSMICTLVLGLTVMYTKQAKAVQVEKRLWGVNRYETGSKIVNEGWTSSKVAIIASGEGFADALCATPLARKYNAPILLTGREYLDLNTKNQLERLNVKDVFVIGGTGPISDNVLFELKTMNIKTTRIYGKDRFETSVQVAKKLDRSNEIVVSNGFSFGDALSIAPMAAQKGIPIILTNKESLPKQVEEFLENKNYNKSYIVGGEGVVSEKIAFELKNSIRIGGKNRYATNALILNFFANEFNYDKVYVASGEDYPDALGVSGLAALNKSPLILVGNYIEPLMKDVVNEKNFDFSELILLGGNSVVSDFIVNKLINGQEYFPNNNLEENISSISLLGESQVTLQTMKNWARSKGATQRFIDNASLYVKYGKLTGIRADVLYAQSALETAFGRFGGAVTKDMNNFAGIKIKNPMGDRREDHETFSSPEDGVRAHFNHIGAYCGVNPIGKVHDRYYIVKSCSWSGTIKNVAGLAGKYCPNPNYSKNLINNFLNDLLSFRN